MILAIDDSPLILAVVIDLLGQAGYQVESRTTGRDGIAAAGELLPDLVLLDVHLPDREGWDVCRELKSDAVTADIPVIFMTGEHTAPEHVVRGLELGAADYIEKPFHPRVLRQRVASALRELHARRDIKRLADARADALAALANAQLYGSETARRTSAEIHATRAAHEIESALLTARQSLLAVEARLSPEDARVVREAVDELDVAAHALHRLRRQNSTDSVTDIVRTVVSPMAESLRKRGVEISQDLQPATATLGAARLAPVVSELIGNAARAMPDKGRIGVRTFTEDGWAVIEVGDDGPGIHRGLDAGHEARSLGIPMCHAIVNSLGGSILIDSAPSGGTRVRVRVPGAPHV
jgi:DNA-binding response OmpR family regulator